MRRSCAQRRRLSRGRFGEIVEEPTESPAPNVEEEERGEEEEDKAAVVYVAVGRDFEEGKKNLSWVLRNTPVETKIVFVHVLLPPQKIPLMGGWFPANQAREDQIAAYKMVERNEIEQQLDEYINMCTCKSKGAEKLVIEGNDVGKAIAELITQYGITELVMGAAEQRKLFHWGLKATMSRAALAVQQQADPSCIIQFVYQGNLISTRPKSEIASAKGFIEFSYLQLKHATRDFSESSKIGEGGFGSVYKGLLHHKEVAIKVLKDEKLVHVKKEFHQEVSLLSKLRHRNLVFLVGACPEKYAIVFEFLPNGSLEDRLDCKNNTPPLTWQLRTRIAAEVCSALVYLHSEPHCIVHGDVKPENILLDRNLVTKLGDFGLSQLLVHSNTTSTLYYRTDHPGGTPGYMDPEMFNTLEITTKSDVYSFGIILLRLLTGKSPFGIIQEVQEALKQDLLSKILDPSAGQWPYVHAKMLAEIGLRCCEIERKKRPRANVALLILQPWLKGLSESSRNIPSHFICPVLQEIMMEPYTAADGYTYEARAIKDWLSLGLNISPMTGLELPSIEVFPNVRLRNDIQKWLWKKM